MRLNLTAKGDNQKAILQYLEENVSDILAEKINSGTKTLQDCWNFIVECAKKELHSMDGAIRDDVVFGWAVHFFEEDSIKPEQPKKEYINKTMSNGDVVRVEAGKKKVEEKPKKEEKKSELELQQITLFDLMGAGNES